MLKAGRLGPIDGLRGIAILMVVWFHMWQITWLDAPAPWLQFIPETGFVGVDVFFFISGFVIVYPFIRAMRNGTPPPTWTHFAGRRFMKIVPSYILCIALMLAVGYAKFPTFAGGAFDVLMHLLFVHTWFNVTYGTINGVLWSLAVEVQFYAIFPLLWWCFRREAWLTTGAMIVLAWGYRSIAVTCCLHTYAGQLSDNLPGYLDIFAVGMISAYLYLTYGDRIASPRDRALMTVAGLIGAAAFATLMMNLFDFRRTDLWTVVWQGQNRTLLGFSLICIALGMLLGSMWLRRLSSNWVLLFFASVSYNWYLYHQVVARGLLFRHIPAYATKSPMDDAHWQMLFSIIAPLVSLALATVLTYGFERPFMRIDFSKVRSPRYARTGVEESA